VATLGTSNKGQYKVVAQSGVELSDKIGEVIIKNTRFQYEHSLAARSVVIFIALNESDSNHKSPR
jgi:hypothetical protein